jgi:hypothetical protein
MLWLRLCICVDLGIGSGRADVGRPLPMDTNNEMILHNEDI